MLADLAMDAGAPCFRDTSVLPVNGVTWSQELRKKVLGECKSPTTYFEVAPKLRAPAARSALPTGGVPRIGRICEN